MRFRFLDAERGSPLGAWTVTTAVLALASVLHVASEPFIPFSLGGSCVLLSGAPDNPMAQPRNLVGGHLIGAVTGLVFGHVLGDGVVVMSSAVGTTILLMMLTRTVHSPAGATPLIAISSHAGWFFVVDPVAVGLVTLLMGRICYQRFWLGQGYPGWWR